MKRLPLLLLPPALMDRCEPFNVTMTVLNRGVGTAGPFDVPLD